MLVTNTEHQSRICPLKIHLNRVLHLLGVGLSGEPKLTNNTPFICRFNFLQK